MNELNNKHENFENDTLMQDDTSFEVKESLFDKIKSALTRPRLGPGNNVKTTNMSFNSWSLRSTFRKAFEAVSNGMSNIMRKKEPEVKNGFATTVIGNDENQVSKTQDTVEKETVQAPNIFIPGNVPGFEHRKNIISTAQPDLLVGNVSKVNDEKISTKLEVEDIDVIDLDENELDKLEDKKTEVTTPKEQIPLRAETINVGTKQQDKDKENNHDLDI